MALKETSRTVIFSFQEGLLINVSGYRPVYCSKKTKKCCSKKAKSMSTPVIDPTIQNTVFRKKNKNNMCELCGSNWLRSGLMIVLLPLDHCPWYLEDRLLWNILYTAGWQVISRHNRFGLLISQPLWVIDHSTASRTSYGDAGGRQDLRRRTVD